MYNTPIAQIVTPAWDSWQTTRFSEFARQSRVEVHTQRDLEDMLAKLDAPRGDEASEETQVDHAKKQRRKFAELAIPGLCLTVMCVVYCIIYLANYGSNMAHCQQMREYLQRLRHVDAAVHAVVGEMQARADFLFHQSGDTDMQSRYGFTDVQIHNVLPSKSSREWTLFSRIVDHRKFAMKTYCIPEQVMRDALFYSEFVSDLKRLVFTDVLQFEELLNWKTYYDLEKHFQNFYDIKLDIVAMNLFKTLEDESYDVECNLITETAFEYVIKVATLFGKLADKQGQSTFKSLTISAPLLKALEYLSNNSVTRAEATEGMNFSQYHNSLKHEEHITRERKEHCYRTIDDMNNEVFSLDIFYFIVILTCICLTGFCIYAFANMLKRESRIVVGVSDWLGSVTTELGEQLESKDDVLKKVIPRVVKDSYELGAGSSMIPYHSAEATLLMCGIAQFDKLFAMFTAGQTLHILTLVMELLDERMEEYNVFPVTRMDSCQVVMSDHVQRGKSQHACEIANLALDIMTCCSDLEIGKQSVSKLQMQIGIHSGPNSGMLIMRNGVLRFHITGTTCEILKKVHKTALPNRTQVSDTTYKLLSACETYSLHMRGNIKVKGLPHLKVFWLDGRKVSSGHNDNESVCSKIGSWIEFERKPLYRLDEEEGFYEPLDKGKSRRFSQMVRQTYTGPRGGSYTGPYGGSYAGPHNGSDTCPGGSDTCIGGSDEWDAKSTDSS